MINIWLLAFLKAYLTEKNQQNRLFHSNGKLYIYIFKKDWDSKKNLFVHSIKMLKLSLMDWNELQKASVLSALKARREINKFY